MVFIDISAVCLFLFLKGSDVGSYSAIILHCQPCDACPQCCARFLPAQRPVPVQWSLLVCPGSVLPTSIFMCQLDSSHACQRQARAVLEAMAPQSPPETQLMLLDVISLTSPSPSVFPSMAGNTREI